MNLGDVVFEARDLHGGYGKALVIQGVSARLEEGELVSLVGPNGSGKSTFIKSVFGLADLFQGEVFLDGQEVTQASPEEKSRLGMGYVPQVDNVFPDLRVRENLEMGAYFQRDREAVRRTAEEIMDLFPILRERKEQKAATLSGGERQMLALGRALMARPSVLFLDEPTAALAPRLVGSLLGKVEEIRSLGVSVFMVEQHARRALEIANRAYVLVQGRVAMEGSGREILADEDLQRVFLGQKGM